MILVPSLLTENNYHNTNNNDTNKVLMNIVVDPRINGRYGRGKAILMDAPVGEVIPIP